MRRRKEQDRECDGRTSRSPIRRLPLILVFVFVALLVGAGAGPAVGQAIGPIQTEVSVFGAGSSTDDHPFWLDANQFGRFDRSGATLGTRVAARRPFSEEVDGFDYGFGVDLLARASDNSTLHAQELYGQLRYGKFQLTAGWKKRTVGRVDTARSLGGMTLSGNATPLPKLSVSTDGYLSVPGTGDYLGVKGYMAHGWMESDRFIRNSFVHEKYGYLRLLPPDFPVTVHAGLIHHAFWGGDPPAGLSGREDEGAFDGGLKQFGRVIFATRGSTTRGGLETGPDHIGNYDFGADVDVGPVQGRIYRQFFFEDSPGLRFRNVWDGLWGGSLRRTDGPALLEAVLYEHFRLIKQGSSSRRNEPAEGGNQAFSHSLFRGGWTHQGRMMGIPLVTPPNKTPGLSEDLPGIANSLVIAHHVALEGTVLPSLSYRLTGTYSENSGSTSVCATVDCSKTIDRRFSRTSQWSFLLETFGTVPGTDRLSYELGLAVDTGDFRDESVGVRVGLTWHGLYTPGGQ